MNRAGESMPRLMSEERNVYAALAQHQRDAAWERGEIFATLQLWAERFILEFKLDIPMVALCIDRLPVTRLGHFHCGFNGFGLQQEIALNERYLYGELPSWRLLGVLMHELLHGWQQAHGQAGKRNYHNVQFQKKAREFGLVVDRRGATTYATESPFKEMLVRYGVEVPQLEPAVAPAPKQGTSKLKKWRCTCTNVRVAVPGFRALCLNCGHEFAKVEKRRRDVL